MTPSPVHPRMLWVLALAALGGCSADQPLNPSFALSLSEAREALREMERSPVTLKRPVVIIGGYLDPGITTAIVRGWIADATGNERILRINTFWCGDFDSCREMVIAKVDEAFPSSDPVWTTEVDVIGHSMGGLVARYAAMDVSETDVQDVAAGDGGGTRRLRIARLFTVATPHRGAQMAELPQWTDQARDMRPGSAFLQRLDAAADRSYELIPYVRLGDQIVGAANAAPRGQPVWWVQCKPLEGAHLSSFRDQRIIADIVRRLRGEAPYTTTPAAPLP